MKIVSVVDKRLKPIVADPAVKSVKGLSRLEVAKIGDMVTAILAMTHPLQLTAVPSWRAHELKHGLEGRWAMFVTGNFRLTFDVSVALQQVSLLDYEDYHGKRRRK